MPELPEVETICRGLRPLILGKTIKSISSSGKSLRRPLPLAAMRDILCNQSVTAIRRRAKYLLLESSGGGLLIVHLGMTGNFGLARHNEALAAHCHVQFQFTDGSELRYSDSRRFGLMAVFTAAQAVDGEREFFAAIGPEPLENTCSAELLWKNNRHRQLPVKATIMDSAVIAGIGNIYASEGLFRARIHPRRTAGSLNKAEWRRLLSSLREVLREAIDCGGSTISDYIDANSQKGYFQMHFKVYDRAGKPCENCGATLEQLRIAGRSSFFCPRCQKEGS